MCSSRASSMPSRTFTSPSLLRRSRNKYTCSSGRDTRTDSRPSSFFNESRTSSNFLGSFILPDSMMPTGILRSPCRPILIPLFAGRNSTNFSDSSEISRPKDGATRNLGVGKNLLYKFRNIITLYDINYRIAIILREFRPGFHHLERVMKTFPLQWILQKASRYFLDLLSFWVPNLLQTYTSARQAHSRPENKVKFRRLPAVAQTPLSPLKA